MDGSTLRHHIAAYRLIPYIQRQELNSVAEQIGITSESEEESIAGSSESSYDTDHPSVSSDA